MTYELTNDEKITIISNRIKNVELAKYDAELAIQEENAVESPSAAILAGHQARLNDILAKKAVLEAELEKVS